jgi:uncharacterized protein
MISQPASRFEEEARDQPDVMRDTMISFGGEDFIADLSGALIHVKSSTLIVADLHLEKGSFFAMRRQMLPPYDTAATLARLNAVVAKRGPKRIVALGDSFHDKGGPDRLPSEAIEALSHLGRLCEMIFIAGNHDPQGAGHLAGPLAGPSLDEMRIGGVTLRHEPKATPFPQIVGHLHPVARVVSSKGSLRRRCFAQGRDTLILPAFGAYTGGLNIRDSAILAAMDGDVPFAHVLGDSRIFAVPPMRTAPDRA